MFRPVKYNHTATKFVDVSTHSDHALAIDQEGNIWGWGCNQNKRAGIKDDIYDGIFEPIKIAFPEKEGLRAIQAKVGFDHSLVLFEEVST